MTEYIVSEKEEGLTLFKYAMRVLPEAPSGLIYKFLRKKNIELNGKRSDGRSELTAGDRIGFFLSDETFEKLGGKTKESHQLENDSQRTQAKGTEHNKAGRPDQMLSIENDRILYEDDDYLFYDKPAGLRTQSDGTGRISLNDLLLIYTGYDGSEVCKPSVCNRLDTNTSGIVLCGKSIKGLQMLNNAIRERRIKKYYRALLNGRFTDEEKKSFENGRLHFVSYISKAEGDNKVKISAAAKSSYKEIITELVIIGEGHDITYAELELITGRKHQIRAQMAYSGHTVTGDIKYGTVEAGKIKAKRQMLHSYRTELPKEILDGLTISAPIPQDMRECLAIAGINER